MDLRRRSLALIPGQMGSNGPTQDIVNMVGKNCRKMAVISDHTVDGRNPAPVDR